MVGVLLLLLLLTPPSATATVQLCGSGGNYTANNTYQSNLAVLATSLASNASSSQQLFATGSTGQSPDACSFQDAQQACPNRKGAAVYYEYDNPQRPGCVVGFSGDDGFLSPVNGITDNATLFQSWNQNNISGDSTSNVVPADVHNLLTVMAQDATDDPVRRYATTVLDSVPTLYSLAQCTPDLSAGDCLACLQRLNSMVNATTSICLGGRIFVLRCNIRFEAFMFFDQPTKLISPSSIALASAGKSMCISFQL
ncbi:hypothetical protein ACQ4PT_070712 [Festuca glaucescens]